MNSFSLSFWTLLNELNELNELEGD